MGTATPATMVLDAAGTAYTLHSYDHDPRAASFGAEAAEALGTDPDQVFKTLLAHGTGGLVCAVVPVSGQLDLKALAAACGSKHLTMADPATAERSSGYVVGGISPLGQRTRLPTFIDETAQLWDTIHVSGGRRGLEIELAPDDLVRLTGGAWAAIGR